MEKYNVVLDDEQTKTASTSKTCPKCGAKLPEVQFEPNKDGELVPQRWCPNCGTEPWEKKRSV